MDRLEEALLCVQSSIISCRSGLEDISMEVALQYSFIRDLLNLIAYVIISVFFYSLVVKYYIGE